MIYNDFFNDFISHPDTHDIATKNDSRAIQQSMYNIIMTDKYERPHRKDLGCGVRSLLFAELSTPVAQTIEQTIKDALNNHEKRIVLKDVKAEIDQGNRRYNVTITYYELNNPAPSTLRIQLYRVR